MTVDEKIAQAMNPDTSVEILIELSKDENEEVRAWTAEHVNCPIDILEKLSKDSYEVVRCAVTRNENTPIEVLSELESDENESVREMAEYAFSK